MPAAARRSTASSARDRSSPGGTVERSLLGTNTRINSFAHVQDSILFDGVDIGRHAASAPGDHRQGRAHSAGHRDRLRPRARPSPRLHGQRRGRGRDRQGRRRRPLHRAGRCTRLAAGHRDVGRKKKAPGKAVSQGGRGQQPFPGAIGRFRRLAAHTREPAVSSRVVCIRSVPLASLPAESASGSAEKSLARLSQCRPIHMDCWRLFVCETENSASCETPDSRVPLNARRENRRIIFHGQGRFFASSTPVFPLPAIRQPAAATPLFVPGSSLFVVRSEPSVAIPLPVSSSYRLQPTAFGLFFC